MSRFYDTSHPDGPHELAEYTGPHHGVIRVGDRVVYENPAWRRADGSYATGGMDGTCTVTEIITFDEAEPVFVQAILNDGEFECSADNLRAL